MLNRAEYWDKQNQILAQTGKLTDDAFDFIGIHKCIRDNQYTISVPSALHNASRNEFCELTVRSFPTLAKCVSYARRLKRRVNRFTKLNVSTIVDCR